MIDGKVIEELHEKAKETALDFGGSFPIVA